MTWEQVLLIVVTILLVILFGVTVWFFGRLRGLIRETKEEALLVTVKKILEKEKLNETEIKKIGKEIESIQEANLLNYQKIGLVRFNPFKEIGGDHSFSLALLDGHDSGLLLTGLHTRDRTRLYLKGVRKGKCEYEVSKDEQKSIDLAVKGRK